MTEALLVDLVRRVQSEGRAFLLVAASSHHQVHPDPEIRRHRLEVVAVGTDHFYWNRPLAQLADCNGIEFLSVSQPFLENAIRSGECFHGFPNMLPCDGHWNAEGHNLASERVAHRLCDAQTG